MALQTLNTIKQWFRTGLKPTQAQFWDTWDSFRHKFDKIPVKEVEGLDELLLSKADKTVLDHHLADKNAHAPQVNTDWNSESGFSQLLNKPEFKTINGESLTGDGDIIIEAGGSQDLQTTLANGNETTNGIMFNDDYYNWLKTSIDSRSIRLTDSNSDMLVAIDSAGVVTRDDSQHVSLNPQGIFFNRDTAESYLRINTSSTGVSTVNLPATEGVEITLTATDDFKTINGESIIGEGNLDIEAQGLKSVLDADPTASYGQSKATVMGDYGTSKYNELIVSDEIEKTGIYQLKNQLSFDHTALDSNDIGNITLSEGNIKLTRDKSNNQTVVDIADPVANTQLRFPAKSEEGKTYTIATTEDFKTINGESIVGSGDIAVSGGNGDIPTLQEVLDKDRNATNASINLISEEGESQTTVHEGGLNISEKTETGFLITDINKLGVSVSKDEETTFANISADELSLNKNLSGNPVKQGIVLNEDSAGTSTIKLPLTSDGDVKTLATTDDFKTINGESIVGEGDIIIGGGGSQSLDHVLATGNTAIGKSIKINADASGNGSIGVYKSDGNVSTIIDDGGFRTASANESTGMNAGGVYTRRDGNISASYVPSGMYTQNSGVSYSLNLNKGLQYTKKADQDEDMTFTNILFDSTNKGEFTQTFQSKSGTVALLSDILGDSQNLQQVLDVGNEADSEMIFNTELTKTTVGVDGLRIGANDYNSSTSVDIDHIQVFNASLEVKGERNSYRTVIEPNSIKISKDDGSFSNTKIYNNKIEFLSIETGRPNRVKLLFEDIDNPPATDGNYTQILPYKSGTIALLSDILPTPNLQRVLDVNPTALDKDIILRSSNGSRTVIESNGIIGAYGVSGDIELSSLAMVDRFRFEASSNLGNYRGDIQPPNPIPYGDNTKFRLPAKGNGEFTFATSDDINLDNVLENGNTAVDKYIRIIDLGVGGSAYFNGLGFGTKENSTNNSVAINPGEVVITKHGARDEDLTIKANSLLYRSSSKGMYNPLNFGLPINKDPGYYTLATTDDIPNIVTTTLQQVLEAGNSSTEEIFLNKATIGGVVIEKGEDYSPYRENETSKLTLGSLVISMDDKMNPSHFVSEFRPNYIQNFKTNPDNSGNSIVMNPGGFSHSYFNGDTVTVGSLSVKSDITNVHTSTYLKYPVKNGTFTIATTEDIKLKSYTVSTLPTGTIGDQAYVTDATAPTYLGTLIGGGSVVCPVFYNGTTWVSH